MKERSAAYWAAIDELTVLRLRRESPAAVLAAVEREEADEVPVYDPAELAYPGSERRWCARADCGRVFWSRRPWHLYCRTACASLAGSRRYYDRWRRKRFSPREPFSDGEPAVGRPQTPGRAGTRLHDG